MISFPLDIYPGVRLLNHIIVLFWISWGTSMLFSIVAAPVYIPTSSAQAFLFLHIHSSICYLLSFWNNILTGVKWHVIVGFFVVVYCLFVLFVCFYFGCAGSLLRCSTRALCCGAWASLVVAGGLSCPAACEILVPRPRIKPACPALEGGFLPTGPPGKSLIVVLICISLMVSDVEHIFM